MYYVKIINQKIAKLDTIQSEECNIPLSEELIGTSLSKCLYINGQFIEDTNWVDVSTTPTESDTIEYIRKYCNWIEVTYTQENTKTELVTKITDYKASALRF